MAIYFVLWVIIQYYFICYLNCSFSWCLCLLDISLIVCLLSISLRSVMAMPSGTSPVPALESVISPWSPGSFHWKIYSKPCSGQEGEGQ